MSEPTGTPEVPRRHVQRGRPPLRIATNGRIRVKKDGDRWIAQTRVRDVDGRVRQAQRQAATKEKAIEALRLSVADRPGFAAERLAKLRTRVNGKPAPADPPAKPHVVYRFYDATDQLMYVGISLSGLSRMSQHQAGKHWWGSVARTDLQHYPDRATARAVERVAIRDEGPLYNIAP